jgi:hypothetical protein
MGGVNESMTGVVHFDREIFACLFVHALDLLNLLHRDATISASIESQHRRIDLRYFFGSRIIACTIERNNCAQIGISGNPPRADNAVSQNKTDDEIGPYEWSDECVTVHKR